MKVLKVIKKVFTAILLLAFFSITIFLTILLLSYNKYGITQFDDTSLLIVKKAFATEEYKKGDLLLVESSNVDKYKLGDTLFVYHLDGQGGATIEFGKIGNIYPDDKAIAFENGDTYSEEFIMGTPTKIYSGVGKYLSIVESKWGFLFMILVPNFFIFIYQLYALIVEIKYGKEDDE